MTGAPSLFPPDALAPSAPAVKPAAEVLRPRWYQTESFRQIESWYAAAREAGQPFARGLVDWATGAGKGFAALEVVNAFPHLVRHGYLFLVEYDSIVWQQAQEFRRAFPHLRVDVEKATHRADFSQADIVVASVQTLGQHDPTHPKGFSKRLLRVPPMGVVAYDEAHRIVHGGMGDRVLSYLGMSEGKYGPMRPEMRPDRDTPGLLLLFTATPNRTDGQGLHYWCGSNHTTNPYATDDSLTNSFDLHFMVQEGFLVGPRGYHVYTDSDLTDVAVKRGKFVDAELKEAITTEARNLQIVKAFLERREETRTGGHAVVFTRWVDHAYVLAQMFRDVGVSAEAGDGEMHRVEKRAIEGRFKSGETRVLVNANLWAVGFNAPICDMVLHAEPTMSQNLYSQRAGRASRATCDLRGLEERGHREERLAKIAASEKPFFINIDFIDQEKRASHRRQPLVTVTNLFGVPAGIDPKGRLIKEVKDRIDQLQREHPAKKILDGAKSLEDVEVRAERVDVWDVLETAPEILEVSDNKWLRLREGIVELGVPLSKARAETRALTGGDDFRARAVQEATGKWRVDRVFPSHWDRVGRRQVPERVERGPYHYDSLKAATAAVDGFLHEKAPEIVRLVERQPDATWKPTQRQVNYLRNLGAARAGVQFTEAGNPVSARTGKAMTGAEVSEMIDALKALKGK